MPSPLGQRNYTLDLSDDDPRTLAPLRRIFLRFSSFGRGHRIDVRMLRMDGRTFVKFCRDTGLLSSRSMSQTAADLIFAKLRRHGERAIDFVQFLVALRHVAAHRGVSKDKLIAFVLKQHGLAISKEEGEGTEVTPTKTSPSSLSSHLLPQQQRAPDRAMISTPPPPHMHPQGCTPPPPLSSEPLVNETAAIRCAIIVIDMQVDFYSKNPAVSSAFPNLPQRIKSLLDEGRSCHECEVVHLREGSNADDSPWYEFWQQLNPGCDSASDPALPEPCAREVGREKVFIKLGYDGVGVDSGLEGYLSARKVSTVFVCGLLTSCCVHMNAAGLFLRGYRTFCVADACGDRTMAMHLESLRREARRSYGVIESNDVFTYLQALKEERGGNGKGDLDGMLLDACWPNLTQSEK